MEKLTPKQQQVVNKTSTERLRLLLAKAGYDLEAIGAADRPSSPTNNVCRAFAYWGKQMWARSQVGQLVQRGSEAMRGHE